MTNRRRSCPRLDSGFGAPTLSRCLALADPRALRLILAATRLSHPHRTRLCVEVLKQLGGIQVPARPLSRLPHDPVRCPRRSNRAVPKEVRLAASSSALSPAAGPALSSSLPCSPLPAVRAFRAFAPWWGAPGRPAACVLASPRRPCWPLAGPVAPSGVLPAWSRPCPSLLSPVFGLPLCCCPSLPTNSGAPPGTRTQNLRIKSPLLCQIELEARPAGQPSLSPS